LLLFSLQYAGAELRRRWSRALITALGLGAAVSLIVAITALSTGFNRAGAQVLSPLGKVGSDLVVTQTASDVSAADSPGATALLQANRSVVTNLAALGKPGAHFTHDFFLLPSMLPVPGSTTARLAALPHVQGAVGALVVLASHQTGIVPKMVASLTSGGQTVSQLHRPTSLTPAEATTVRSCILTDGGLKSLADSAAAPSKALPAQIEKCLPTRFKEYVAQVNVPVQTVKQVLNPPQTNIRATPYTAAGIDPTHPDDGLVTRAQLASGRFLGDAADEVLADAGYAASAGLRLGSTLPINGQAFHVVGLVTGGIGGQSANLYLPLAAMQSMAGQAGNVNVILVHADSAAAVASVQTAIHRLLPTAKVATATQLADRVKGSLATAKKLTNRFGGALAVVVLLAAFLITILLTLGSVAKRVREIGTLRAVGWSRRRVVGQLVLESLGIASVGALIGIGLGATMAAAITHFAPSMDAHSTLAAGGASLTKLAGVVHHSEVASSVHVRIVATVSALSLLAGTALALFGGLIAGVVGGWRAACLTPSVALRDIG
jgi:ABC-type antimicrobial peptide transport system permease subunit